MEMKKSIKMWLHGFFGCCSLASMVCMLSIVSSSVQNDFNEVVVIYIDEFMFWFMMLIMGVSAFIHIWHFIALMKQD